MAKDQFSPAEDNCAEIGDLVMMPRSREAETAPRFDQNVETDSERGTHFGCDMLVEKTMLSQFLKISGSNIKTHIIGTSSIVISCI